MNEGDLKMIIVLRQWRLNGEEHSMLFLYSPVSLEWTVQYCQYLFTEMKFYYELHWVYKDFAGKF